MTIIVDAMGSDAQPVPDVAGAVLAARDLGETIILVGDKDAIQRELDTHQTSGLNISIRHASEAITMEDKPSVAARQKKDSSMHVGLNMVKAGEGDAFVSMGNTGGVLAVATLQTLKRIKGVKRPVLCAIFTTPGNPLLCDSGANADVKPEYLEQFAIMGSLYAEKALGITNPRVGIISNGEEEGKGSELIKEAIPLLQAAPINYVGNTEPKQFLGGEVDVGVCDGFTGNIMLKTAEATASMLLSTIREEIYGSTRTKLGGFLAKPAFDKLRTELGSERIGGVPLLGVNGVVIIGHGSSSAIAVKNAIKQARTAVNNNLVEAIQAQFQSQ